MALFIKREIKHQYETEIKFFPVVNHRKEYTAERVYRELDKDNLDESILESLARTKRTIKEYARNNDFDYFVTLTIDPRKYDTFTLDTVLNLVRNFLRKLRRKHDYKTIDFEYILVPECQNKESQGIHLHGYIKGDLNLKKAINSKTGNYMTYKGKQVYNVLEWPYGFSTAVKISKSIDDTLRCSNYITKYVTKELLVNFNKKRFWCSKGLKKGSIIRDSKVCYDNIGELLENELPDTFYKYGINSTSDVNFYDNDYYACITLRDKINQVE